MMNMELLGKRKRGRPQQRFVDVVRKDMQRVGLTRRLVSSCRGQQVKHEMCVK